MTGPFTITGKSAVANAVLSATADTNIYISALEFGGLPLRLLDHAAVGDIRLHISDAILEETLGVLRDKFGWQEAALRDAVTTLAACTERVVSTQTVDVITADPSDNRILECAVAAKSDLIVTGDKRHILPLGSHDGIPIVTLAQFIQRMQGQQR